MTEPDDPPPPLPPGADCIVDLSHNNASVDWPVLYAQGCRGAIHKVSEGIGCPDIVYAYRRQRAAMMGMLWGAYHFGTGMHPGDLQADEFIRLAHPDEHTLCALDWEWPLRGPAMQLESAVAWVERVYAATGRWPVVYTGEYAAELLRCQTAHPVLSQCRLWLARYTGAPVLPHATWATWWAWQYTDGAQGPLARATPGVAGLCDRSLYHGTAAQLMSDWS